MVKNGWGRRADVQRLSSTRVMGQFLPPEPMQRAEPPTGPWHDVAADLMGSMPRGENLLVVVDHYSHYYEVVVDQDS